MSQVLAALFRDGGWTRAWSPVAALVPPVAFGMGLFVAVHQQQPLWSYDLAPMVVMSIAAGLGAGVGLWAGLGYLVGLFGFFSGRGGLPLSATPMPYISYRALRGAGKPFFYSFDRTYLGLLVAVAVLFGLGVLVPAVAAACRMSIQPIIKRFGRARPLVEGAVSTVVAVVAAWQWTLAVQYSIRPYWTFANQNPASAAFQPVHNHSALVCQLVLVASVGRWVLTAVRPEPRPVRVRNALPARSVWWPFSIAGQSAAVTLLAGGILADVDQGRMFAGVVACGLFFRQLVFPRIPGLARVVHSVPVAIRLGLLVATSVVMSVWRVGGAYASFTSSLSSFPQTAAVTIAVSSLLFVSRPPRPWLPAFATRARPHPPVHLAQQDEPTGPPPRTSPGPELRGGS